MNNPFGKTTSRARALVDSAKLQRQIDQLEAEEAKLYQPGTPGYARSLVESHSRQSKIKELTSQKAKLFFEDIGEVPIKSTALDTKNAFAPKTDGQSVRDTYKMQQAADLSPVANPLPTADKPAASPYQQTKIDGQNIRDVYKTQPFSPTPPKTPVTVANANRDYEYSKYQGDTAVEIYNLQDKIKQNKKRIEALSMLTPNLMTDENRAENQKLIDETKANESRIAELQDASYRKQQEKQVETMSEVKLNPDYKAAISSVRPSKIDLGDALDKDYLIKDKVAQALDPQYNRRHGTTRMTQVPIAEITGLGTTEYNFLNSDEKEILKYYVAKNDWNGAGKYLDALSTTLTQRKRDYDDKSLEELAKSGVGGKVVSVALNVAGTLDSGRAIGDMVGKQLKESVTGKYQHVDINSSAYSGVNLTNKTSETLSTEAYNAAYKGTGSEFWAEVASQGTGIGLSILQNAARYPFAAYDPSASLLMMATGAAGQTAAGTIKSGGTKSQAITLGVSAGLVEYLTEKASLDSLFDIVHSSGRVQAQSVLSKAIKSFTSGSNLLRQGVTEASEEIIAELANNILDQAVMGEKSGYEQYVKYLKETGGYSDADARKAATTQFYVTNVVWAGIGGAVSGGVMGGGGSLIGAYKLNKYDSDTGKANRENANVVITQGKSYSTDTASRKLADKLSTKTKISDAELGKLVRYNIHEQANANRTNYLAESGAENAETLSRVIGHVIDGEAISNKQAEQIIASPAALSYLEMATGIKINRQATMAEQRKSVKNIMQGLSPNIVTAQAEASLARINALSHEAAVSRRSGDVHTANGLQEEAKAEARATIDEVRNSDAPLDEKKQAIDTLIATLKAVGEKRAAEPQTIAESKPVQPVPDEIKPESAQTPTSEIVAPTQAETAPTQTEPAQAVTEQTAQEPPVQTQPAQATQNQPTTAQEQTVTEQEQTAQIQKPTTEQSQPEAQTAVAQPQIAAASQNEETAGVNETAQETSVNGTEQAQPEPVTAEQTQPKSGKTDIEDAKEELADDADIALSQKSSRIKKALDSGALTSDNFTTTGKVAGFTPEQQQSLIKSLIDGLGDDTKVITAHIPGDGTFRVRNTTKAVANLLEKLKVRPPQTADIDQAAVRLFSTNTTAYYGEYNGKSYIVSGTSIIRVTPETIDAVNSERQKKGNPALTTNTDVVNRTLQAAENANTKIDPESAKLESRSAGKSAVSWVTIPAESGKLYYEQSLVGAIAKRADNMTTGKLNNRITLLVSRDSEGVSGAVVNLIPKTDAGSIEVMPYKVGWFGGKTTAEVKTEQPEQIKATPEQPQETETATEQPVQTPEAQEQQATPVAQTQSEKPSNNTEKPEDKAEEPTIAKTPDTVYNNGNEQTEKPAQSEAIPTGNEHSHKVAQYVAARLAERKPITRQEVNAYAKSVYGNTLASGELTIKDINDAMELGVNQYILSMDPSAKEYSAVGMMELMGMLPTQTNRTEEQEKYQQFSTPPSIAYLVNYAANIQKGDTVLEPSAGIGGIAVFAKKAGAKVIVNELDKRRLEVIKNLPFDEFYNENAEQLDNILGDKIKPTVVVMNPPFSSSAARNVKEHSLGAKHVEEALKVLRDGGRLVAVVGRGMNAEAPSFREWWNTIKQQYSVRANVGLDGKNYSKYGTSFDIQLLVIDKTGPTTGEVVTGNVETIQQLQTKLEDIRNDRQITKTPGQGQETQSDARKPESRETVRTGESSGRPVISESDTSADVRAGGNNTGASGSEESGGGTDNVRSGGTNVSPAGESGGRRGSRNGKSETDTVGDNGGIGSRTDNQPANGDQQGTPIEPTATAGKTKKKAPTKKTELSDSMFDVYVPQKLNIKGAKQHPSKIAESSAMAAIEPPDLTYVPKIPQSLIDSGTLSDVQLEAISYAGQSHSQTLPDGKTRGFFIGDGTGVGKGREIAGIILDRFNQGDKKALWISENKGLVVDAKRDLKAIHDKDDMLVVYEGGKKAEKILKSQSGVMFATYSTLADGFQKGAGNLNNIVNWLGKDFDGAIIFDESHNMANSAPTKGKRGTKKPSFIALAGIQLQEMLPKAKIVYSSATGATEVSNLRYAERLGLWGQGTSFVDGNDFVEQINAGGIAAMEVVSRSMKAMGVYVSRNLSYDGVGYKRRTHSLTATQKRDYNDLADAWAAVSANINAALNETSGKKNSKAKMNARSAFWSAQQRFFNQVVTTMQVPTLIQDMEKQLADGKSVVIQLTSTNEAHMKRALAAIEEKGESLDEYDATPKAMIIEYLEKSFPIWQYEEYIDEDGNKLSRPVLDSKGNPVINRKALKMRDDLITKVNMLRFPDAPIDMIINHFGADNVAENTGRTQRIIVDENGHKIVQKLPSNKDADVQAFQGGKKRIIIFSEAGGTGKSYHADRSAANQQQRIHYLLQAGWKADAAVQGFGRSHRSNQVIAPEFVLLNTDLSGQKRFISTIARRLDQLGALTKGQKDTGSQGIFNASDNLEGRLAEAALEITLRHIAATNRETLKRMGLDSILDEYGNVNNSATDLKDINKFLNRIFMLRFNEQNEIFDIFDQTLQNAITRAQEDGTYNTGLENYKADRVHVEETQDIKTDENSGAKTQYYRLTAFNKLIPVKYEDIDMETNKYSGIFKNPSTGTLRALYTTADSTDAFGNITQNYRALNPRGKYDIVARSKFKQWFEVKGDEAKTLWSESVEKLPTETKTAVHVVGGEMLSVWDRLPQENVRIRRFLLDDGTQLIGRTIPEKQIDETLRRIGISRTKETITAAQALEAINRGGTAQLVNGWKIRKRKVSGEDRIEIEGIDYYNIDIMVKRYGLFSEKISYTSRLFVPNNETTADKLDQIFKSFPVDKVAEQHESEYFIGGKNLWQTSQSSESNFNDLVKNLAEARGIKVVIDDKINPNGAYVYSDGSYASPFYSKLAREIDTAKQDKFAANGLIPYLLGKGVKQDEIKWLGLESFIEGKKSVTKAELLEYVKANDIQIEENTVDQPKYDKYAVGGQGKGNYREVIFTMPNAAGEFKSPHWDEKNVIAHTRLQDFTDSDGNKVLFVEEVQSDWHEEGRERGYSDRGGIEYLTEAEMRELNQLQKEAHEADYDEDVERAFYRSNKPERLAELQAKYDRVEAADIQADKRVPDAPFKSTWHELVLKRILRMAAEGGYDKVAWTTGAMQAERYSLEQHFESITAEPNSEGKPNQYDVVSYTENDFDLKYTGTWTPAEVVNIFGKDIGTRLIDGADKDGFIELTGDGLKVGGEGMKNFYDIGGRSSQNIPKFLQKYTKPWGAEIGTTTLETGDTVPSVTVTPKMRESVLYEGQARFSAREDIYSDNFKKWFGDWENEPGNASKVVDKDGKPRVMYRGDNDNYTVFDKSYIGTGNGLLFGAGFYFATNEDVASQYGKIRKYYLNAKNPFNLNKPDRDLLKTIVSQFQSKGIPYNKSEAMALLRDYKAGENFDGGWEEAIQSINDEPDPYMAFTEKLKSLGYDGIDAGTEYIVFEPNQIKSATDNIGTYDPNNADIRYSLSQSPNAYYDRATKTIHISREAAKSHTVLLGHELYHSLSDDDQARIAWFFRENSDTQSEAFKAFKKERMEAYQALYGDRTFTEKDFWQEYAAENCETLFTDESYIKKLAGKSKSLAQKILDFIREMLARLTRSTFKYSRASLAGNLSYDTLLKAERMYADALGVKSSDIGKAVPAPTLSEIASAMKNITGVPWSIGKVIKRGASGIYKVRPEAIRTKMALDIPTASHELGHHIDKKHTFSADPESDYMQEIIGLYGKELSKHYKDDEIPGESVAEYFREFITDRAKVTEKAPIFSQYINQALTDTELDGIVHISDMFNAYLKSGIMSRYKASERTDAYIGNVNISQAGRNLQAAMDNPRNAFRNWKMNWTVRLFDRFAPIKAAEQSITGNMDIYKKVSLLARVDNLAYQALAGTEVYGINLEPLGIDSLAKITSEYFKQPQDEENYRLYHRNMRAITLAERGIRTYADETMQDPDEMLKANIKLEAENPWLPKALSDVTGWQQIVGQEFLVNSGLISQELFDKLWEQDPYYIPFYRVMDSDAPVSGSKKGIVNQPDAIRRIKGSGRDTKNVLENLGTSVSNMIKAGMRNQAATDLADLMDSYDGTAVFMEKVPPTRYKVTIGTDSLLDRIEKVLSDEQTQKEMGLDDGDTAFDLVSEAVGDNLAAWRVGNQKSNVVRIMRDGNPVYYEVHDKNLLTAITEITPVNALRTIASLTKNFKVLTTGVNPIFMVRNPLRDIKPAFVKSTTTNNIAKYLGDDLVSVGSIIRNSKEYQAYMDAGGGYAGSVTEGSRAMRSSMTEVRFGGNKSLSFKLAFRKFGAGLEWLGRLVDMTDQINRFAEYQRVKKKGGTEIEAQYRAARSSVDFSVGGTWAKQIDKFIPYFNAAITSMYQSAQTMTTNAKSDGASKVAAAWLKYIGTGLLSAGVLALFNFGLAPLVFDEDKDKIKEAINSESSHMKNNYWLFYSGNGKFIRLPKSQSDDFIFSAAERLIENQITGNNDAFYDLGAYARNVLLPSLDIILISDLFELGMNQSWSGSPIVPLSLTSLDPRLQYNENTTSLAVEIGDTLNVSPMKIDYLLDQNLGIIGDVINGVFGSEKPNPYKWFTDAFTTDSVYSTDIISKFYKDKDEHDKNTASYKATDGKDKRYTLSDTYNSYKYGKYADLYSTVKTHIDGAADDDTKRNMRQAINTVIDGVNKSGVTELDNKVLKLMEQTGYTAADIAPYISVPDKLTIYQYNEAGHRMKDANGDYIKRELPLNFNDVMRYNKRVAELFARVYPDLFNQAAELKATPMELAEALKEYKSEITKKVKEELSEIMLERE